MFNVGDLIICSAHDICRIWDIEEKTFLEVQRKLFSTFNRRSKAQN